MKNVKIFITVILLLSLAHSTLNAQTCIEEYRLYVLSGEFEKAADLKLQISQEFDLIDLNTITNLSKRELLAFAKAKNIFLNKKLSKKAMLIIIRKRIISKSKEKLSK